MKITPAGDRGALVELGAVGYDDLHRITRAIRTTDGIAAAVPGHHSILAITRSSGIDAESLIRSAIDRAESTPLDLEPSRHRIETSFLERYSPDLALLLAHLRVERNAFLGRLSELTFRARFLGFMAGFAYLDGLPPEWELPRRTTPRARVPKGSFAIAGEMAGFYPVHSPGGWNILGRSGAIFWDDQRNPPNLVSPGDEIVIVPTMDEIADVRPGRIRPRRPRVQAGEVIDAGQLTLLAGAPDLERLDHGLPPGGAFDPVSAADANFATGNPPDATLLECTLVGPTLRFIEERRCSWYGADVTLRVNGRAVDDRRSFVVPVGGTLACGVLREGMRGWLAIEGGLENPAGRYSLHPERLRTGPLFTSGCSAGNATESSLGRSAAHVNRFEIAALAGPHSAEPETLQSIARREWEVSGALDRTGIRFESDLRPQNIPARLPSCGMQFGTVQLHPDGSLVAMGPDHPVTGGYLQPFTIVSSQRWKLALLRPGDRIRFLIESRSG
ncbi:MAG: carboxyltransferase domain-containing protein [Thermoanaerobaculia bacterium]